MQENIIIFCGPTISEAEASQYLDAKYLPPAKQGDIYKALQAHSPKIIAIVDGYFENVPSPWHKEILYAMKKGVYVIGASSMGALRAAELSDYGMIGIGEIFHAYYNGKIINDDAVAVVHGPPELGFPSLSDALVNIRATLEKAQKEKIIDASLFEEATHFMEAQFYKARSYNVLVENFIKIPHYKDQIKALEYWLPEKKVDIKKQDSIEMLTYIKKFYKNLKKPNEIDYYFEKTIVWSKMRKEVEREMNRSKSPDTLNILKKSHIFQNCSRDTLQCIASITQKKSFKKGQFIFHKDDSGDSIFVIIDGQINISSISSAGRNLIMNVLGPGDSFGEISFFDHKLRTADAVANSDCCLLLLDKKKWDTIASQITAEDWMAIISGICVLIRKASTDTETLIFYDAQTRLIQKIYSLIVQEKLSERVNNGYILKCSQDKLASMLGITREMTNKILSNIEADGLISKENRKIFVKDINLLVAFLEKVTGYDYQLPYMA